MHGSFSEDALEQFAQLAAQTQSADFSEDNTYDFTRCVRPDGSAYGTGGKCRKGAEQAKGIEPKNKSVEEPAKPKIGGELVGSPDKITGGKAKKQIEDRIKHYEDTKEEFPDASELIDHELKRLKYELDGFKANEAILNGVVANVPAGTKVSVSAMGYIVTEIKTKSGHTVRTSFGRGDYNFEVNGKYDAGSVTDRREQIEVANTVRRTYEALIRSLPDKAVISTSAWTLDGRGESRMRAYEKMGFSKPTRMENSKVVEGEPGDKQYAKKEGGRIIPATHSERSEDRSYTFSESLNSAVLWYIAIFGVERKS